MSLAHFIAVLDILSVHKGSFDSTVKLWDLRFVPSYFRYVSICHYLSAQTRQAIQTLEGARDSIQTLYVGPTFIVTGSVDAHVRTYDLRMGELRSDFIGSMSFYSNALYSIITLYQGPVTSVLPTQDAQTVLVTTLDSHIRLMDAATGKMLNQYTGHANESYRCRACFGHGEGTVICGDEKGLVWTWDLLEVRLPAWSICEYSNPR